MELLQLVSVYKFCASWVLKQLTDFYKTQRTMYLNFLEHQSEESKEYLYGIVFGDETWAKFINVRDQILF